MVSPDTPAKTDEPEPVTPWWELSGMERELAKYDQCEEPGDCDHDHDNAIEYFREQELNALRERAEKAEAELAKHTLGPRLHGLRLPNGHVVPGDAGWCLRRAATGEGEFVEAETCVYRGQWHEVGRETPRASARTT